jgi:hypothetical protein
MLVNLFLFQVPDFGVTAADLWSLFSCLSMDHIDFSMGFVVCGTKLIRGFTFCRRWAFSEVWLLSLGISSDLLRVRVEVVMFGDMASGNLGVEIELRNIPCLFFNEVMIEGVVVFEFWP